MYSNVFLSVLKYILSQCENILDHLFNDSDYKSEKKMKQELDSRYCENEQIHEQS